jgi:hypothetical protein
MRRLIGPFLLAILMPPLAMARETASVAWLGATVEYDRDAWHVTAPSSEGALVFTCTAPECEGKATVYGFAQKAVKNPGSDAPACPMPPDDAGYRNGDLFPLERPPAADGAIAFSAFSIWSGCRAMDNPLYEACAEHEGVIYRMANHFGDSGCNFGPELPAKRFIELLGGVKTNPMRAQ